MTDEFDPLAELGLFPEKMMICSCRGFLTKNNSMRDLCKRFIRNGDHFYDVMRRYDDLICYVLGREDASSGDRAKWIVPFLKAYGVTDHMILEETQSNFVPMPNSDISLRYVSNLMPSYISTSEYRHTMMPVMEHLQSPLVDFYCSEMCLDGIDFGRTYSREIRELAQEINSLKIPQTEYELNVPMELDEYDVEIIRTVDRVLEQGIPGTPAQTLMESVKQFNSSRKAYSLLDIRRETHVDLDSCVYIGSSRTDYQTLDLVRDSGGLAMSFNGSDYAVRGSNVAVLAKDATVGAVFAEVFYNGGIQSIYDLVENWSRKYLERMDFNDRHLLRGMLSLYPNKLPEVYVVNDDNVDEVSARSDEYRKKLLGP